jgi:hypothetical protein
MKCDTKRCKGESIMIYLGKHVCEKCWQKECKEEK